MTTVGPSLPRSLSLFFALAVACLASCGSYEDKRIRELLHEKGFGSRADGDATRENYVAGNDQIIFLLAPDVVQQETLPRLAELTVAQPIAIDGTIFVPYVGPVYVLGKTESEVAALVRAQLRTVIRDEIDLQVRIAPIPSKVFFAIGETGLKGPVALTTDLTFLEAMFRVGWTPLANLGRVYLVRPDAEHPLTIDINFREMLTSGYMSANIQIREHDIVYVPPTFLGLIARLLERLLQPIGLAVRTVIGFAEAQAAFDYLRGDNPFYYRF